jgi:alkyl sulfatase BDS1-like metallo-beta-lactamase superfamily hydrolase
MASLSKLSDRLWSGEISTEQPEHHPMAALNVLEELAPGVGFFKGFVNLTAVRTEEGLVLIDTGGYHPAQHEPSFSAVRRFNNQPLHTAVYTHGHVDHAYGLPPFMRELESKGWARPRIVGHVDVLPRMQRYNETAGYNGVINTRQFGVKIQWPTNPIPPTVTYRERLDLRIGEREFRLSHARGETDDHTWVYVPDARLLCTGDLFIWAVPNAGNPQKVQRYAIEWASALREMAALEPEILLPGHGIPILGGARVREALLDTAECLESLYRQTVERMNEGATIYEIVESVQMPTELREKPYLRPVYDEPEFIVRNIYRCLGGWYSGIPSELKPAPRSAQAREIADLAGGVEKLLARARVYAQKGDLRMASHLVDWALEADPDSAEVHQVRAKVYQQRIELAPSTMSKGIYAAAVRQSETRGKADPLSQS